MGFVFAVTSAQAICLPLLLQFYFYLHKAKLTANYTQEEWNFQWVLNYNLIACSLAKQQLARAQKHPSSTESAPNVSMCLNVSAGVCECVYFCTAVGKISLVAVCWSGLLSERFKIGARPFAVAVAVAVSDFESVKSISMLRPFFLLALHLQLLLLSFARLVLLSFGCCWRKLSNAETVCCFIAHFSFSLSRFASL